MSDLDERAEEARRLVKEAAQEAARLVLTEAVTTDRSLTERGRRRVNIIWEMTQAAIALLVVGATLTLSTLMVVRGNYVEASIQLLSSAFFLVIGFYFGRTNHERVGGVGASR